jgi:hypothetical protein
MSTYVYVSRRGGLFDDEGPRISEDDWRSHAAKQPDFRQPRGSEAQGAGEHARVWMGYDTPVVFDWSEGQIQVKNPDERIVSRMKTIAAALSANVFSENGELFDAKGGHAGFLPGFP